MVEEKGRVESSYVTGLLQKASLPTDVVTELNTLRKVREMNWWWKVNAHTSNSNNPNLMLYMSEFLFCSFFFILLSLIVAKFALIELNFTCYKEMKEEFISHKNKFTTQDL